MITAAVRAAAFMLALSLGRVLPEGAALRTPPPEAAAPSVPLVEVSPSDEHLGELPAGTTATRRVQFRNTWSSVVLVRVVTTSCGCMEARVEPARVGPGETCEVAVSIRAIPAGGEQRHHAEIGVRAEPEGADIQKAVVSVAYQPRVVFLARPDALSWTVLEDAPLASHLLLRSEEGPEVFGEPVGITSAGIPGLECSPALPVAGQRLVRRVDIRAPGQRPGVHCGRITVESEQGAVVVPVVLRVLPAWRAEPAGAIFSSEAEGARELVIRGARNAPVDVAQVVVADADAPVAAAVSRDKGVTRVSVRMLRPPAPGELGSTTLILRDSAGTDRLSVPVVWWPGTER
ncbi:MAG: DUF1573 domain-containing protein [Phycisphaerae bacterium]|nr:DUF1573 domain-containing protein [Phycisphaerae bacterium]